jgi:hypothetical protein
MRYFLAFIVLIFLFNVCSNKKEITRSNGELDKDFEKTEQTVAEPSPTPEELHLKARMKLRVDGWQEETLNNGVMPNCYNYKPKKGSLDNYLSVTVGGGTDVVIKLVNIDTDVCVRYVFVNSGTTFEIKRIPEGRYRLRIAYGKEWFSKNNLGRCIGKFARNPSYEEGNDILDFNVKHTYNGYSVPSFALKLDVISDYTSNSFSSQSISEQQFNQ